MQDENSEPEVFPNQYEFVASEHLRFLKNVGNQTLAGSW